MRGRAAAHHVRCGASTARRHSRRATRHMARRNCTFEPSLCCTPLMARAPFTTRCVCQCRYRASPLDTTSRCLCARIAECAPRVAREMARAATPLTLALWPLPLCYPGASQVCTLECTTPTTQADARELRSVRGRAREALRVATAVILACSPPCACASQVCCTWEWNMDVDTDTVPSGSWNWYGTGARQWVQWCSWWIL